MSRPVNGRSTHIHPEVLPVACGKRTYFTAQRVIEFHLDHSFLSVARMASEATAKERPPDKLNLSDK